ncbi:MAG TPA: hypothetical protein VFK13_10520 [Gemmatimonadaceae bacterium]|nr:hypothetical protein [Gemmatimonadaceae bacterium]
MRTPRLARHIVRAFYVLALGTALATAASCGDSASPDGPPGGGGGNLTLDVRHAVNDSIGAAGGVLTTTTSTGIRYTLTVPAGALESPVRITLTPVSAQANLPVSGGFAGGVALEPSGLHFAHAVELSATLASAPAGLQLAALTFEGDGDSLSLTPLFDSAGTAVTMLTHFSGASFVFGTTADLQALALAVEQTEFTDPVNALFLNRLAALGGVPEQGIPESLPILQDWFAQVILPELQNAGTDAELLVAVGDYDLWRFEAIGYLTGDVTVLLASGHGTFLPLPAALSAEQAQAAAAAAPELRHAIDGNNAECRSRRSVQALVNVLFWQSVAHEFGVDTPAQSLDRSSVIAGLCGRVVADHVSLADPLPTNRGTSLDIVWGVLIGSSPPALPADFAVTVSATGATIGTPKGFTGAGGGVQQGFFTTVVTASGPATINASACLVIPGTTTSIADLCGNVSLDRGGGSSELPTGTWDGTGFFLRAIGFPPGVGLGRLEISGAQVHAFFCEQHDAVGNGTFVDLVDAPVTAPVTPVAGGIRFIAKGPFKDTVQVFFPGGSAGTITLTATTSSHDSVMQVVLSDDFGSTHIGDGSGTLVRVDNVARHTTAESLCSNVAGTTGFRAVPPVGSGIGSGVSRQAKRR